MQMFAGGSNLTCLPVSEVNVRDYKFVALLTFIFVLIAQIVIPCLQQNEKDLQNDEYHRYCTG